MLNIPETIADSGAPTNARAAAEVETTNSTPSGSLFTLLSDDMLRDLPELDWMIEGILPAGAFAELHAIPGSAKSFLAIDWALRVAEGRDWQGRRVKQGCVVYVAAEGVTGYRNRVASWKDANGVQSAPSFFIIAEPVQLLAAAEVDRFIRSLDAAPARPALIILDTLARCIIGGDENSATVMGEVVGAVQRIQKATGAAVLLVHHARKSDSVERGSSALRGALDVMFRLSKNGDLVTLHCEKMKDAPEFSSLPMRLREHGSSCVLHATNAPKELASTPTERQRQLVDLLPPEGAAWATWKRLAENAGIRGGTLSREVSALRNLNLIEQAGKGVWRPAQAPEGSTTSTTPLRGGAVELPRAGDSRTDEHSREAA